MIMSSRISSSLFKILNQNTSDISEKNKAGEFQSLDFLRLALVLKKFPLLEWVIALVLFVTAYSL